MSRLESPFNMRSIPSIIILRAFFLPLIPSSPVPLDDAVFEN